MVVFPGKADVRCDPGVHTEGVEEMLEEIGGDVPEGLVPERAGIDQIPAAPAVERTCARDFVHRDDGMGKSA